MNINFYHFLALDVPPLFTALFAVLACTLVGNFLLLRRMSMMGDAISHAVLPGIVLAFLFTGSRADLPVFIGAALAGLAAVFLIELVTKLGKVESGASMGVVFSIFFALGVVLLEQAAARNIDLDADCLLYGQLETIFWFPPRALTQILSWQTATLLPSELVSSFVVFMLVGLFVIIFYKELKLFCFDPALATALGFGAGVLNTLLMLLAAAAVVVSFKAVGSILVIAMIVVPPACARLCTDRLKTQLWLSMLISVVIVLLGYFAGAFLPLILGLKSSLSVAGMIAVSGGVFLGVFSLFAPRYGIVSSSLRRFFFSLGILQEDLLALQYRIHEGRVDAERESFTKVFSFRSSGAAGRLALRLLRRRKELGLSDGCWTLLQAGQDRARKLIRSHRLWEAYLVDQTASSPDRVHEHAETLEHFTSGELASELARETQSHELDPHGRKIPK